MESVVHSEDLVAYILQYSEVSDLLTGAVAVCAAWKNWIHDKPEIWRHVSLGVNSITAMLYARKDFQNTMLSVPLPELQQDEIESVLYMTWRRAAERWVGEKIQMEMMRLQTQLAHVYSFLTERRAQQDLFPLNLVRRFTLNASDDTPGSTDLLDRMQVIVQRFLLCERNDISHMNILNNLLVPQSPPLPPSLSIYDHNIFLQAGAWQGSVESMSIMRSGAAFLASRQLDIRHYPRLKRLSRLSLHSDKEEWRALVELNCTAFCNSLLQLLLPQCELTDRQAASLATSLPLLQYLHIQAFETHASLSHFQQHKSLCLQCELDVDTMRGDVDDVLSPYEAFYRNGQDETRSLRLAVTLHHGEGRDGMLGGKAYTRYVQQQHDLQLPDDEAAEIHAEMLRRRVAEESAKPAETSQLRQLLDRMTQNLCYAICELFLSNVSPREFSIATTDDLNQLLLHRDLANLQQFTIKLDFQECPVMEVKAVRAAWLALDGFPQLNRWCMQHVVPRGYRTLQTFTSRALNKFINYRLPKPLNSQ